MSQHTDSTPKVFISYSWTSQDHETWVLELAEQLEDSGVHIVLDKWDLKEGADLFAFMEQMVTDPSISKVLVICDSLYAEKADGRKGGVGTETQIITPQVYQRVNPSGQKHKFVPIVTERDEAGQACLPTYLAGRLYIDMSNPATFAERFEQLVRWIYDKPRYKRPERGKPPIYIREEDALNLGTSSRFRFAVEAVRQNKPNAIGALRDYFETFNESLEVLRLSPKPETEFDDLVVESIESFLPYRDQAIETFLTIARYGSTAEIYDSLRKFFERLLRYNFHKPGVAQWTDVDLDNFKFILNELFLYVIASLLKNELFNEVNELTEQGYYLPPGIPDSSNKSLFFFTDFGSDVKSLDIRNQRLKLQRTSLTSDLLRDRAKRADITFEDIMQADFVLYIRSELHRSPDEWVSNAWWPHTLLYASHRTSAFEIFARSQSQKYFNRMKVSLGLSKKDQLDKLIQEFRDRKRDAIRFSRYTFNILTLMNHEKLYTTP